MFYFQKDFKTCLGDKKKHDYICNIGFCDHFMFIK